MVVILINCFAPNESLLVIFVSERDGYNLETTFGLKLGSAEGTRAICYRFYS